MRQSLSAIPHRGCSHTPLHTLTFSLDMVPLHVGASSQGAVIPNGERVVIMEVRYTEGLLNWLSALQGENQHTSRSLENAHKARSLAQSHTSLI